MFAAGAQASVRRFAAQDHSQALESGGRGLATGPSYAARRLALHGSLFEYAKNARTRKTHDWVVIYFHPNSEPETQCTVVTENRGPWRGIGSCEDARETASRTMLRLGRDRHRRQRPTAGKVMCGAN